MESDGTSTWSFLKIFLNFNNLFMEFNQQAQMDFDFEGCICTWFPRTQQKKLIEK